MAPTIIFVPGLWEGPTVFDKVTSILQSQGHSTEVTSLLSTGTTSPGNPNMNDDIANIRSTISKVVEAEEEVLLVLHSAGGFLGSSCIEGLTVKAQKEKGLQGGVVKILFLAAGVLPMGATPPLLPFFEFDGGAINCLNPRENLYHGLSEAEKDEWVKKLRPQPAADWDREIAYCGFVDVPSVYLVCEGDRLLPVELQLQFAGVAGSEVLRCEAGHMVQVSMPEKVVEVVNGVLEGF